MRATSALACSMVTPGLSRAIPWEKGSQKLFGSVQAAGEESARDRAENGIRFGITPITVCGLESIVSVRPMMDVSPPKRRCQ